jgi:hypothetical protein
LAPLRKRFKPQQFRRPPFYVPRDHNGIEESTKNPHPHPHTTTDDLSEAESKDPRERGAASNANTNRDLVLSPQNHRHEEDQGQEVEDVAEGHFEVGLMDA